MHTDIACANRTEQRIDQCVSRNISVAMADEADIMFNVHAAQPQFLTLAEPVDIETSTNPDGRQVFHEISGECQLAQSFITLDQSDGEPGLTGHLSIVAGIGCPFPSMMRRQYFVETESLRRLDSFKDITVPLSGHHPRTFDYKAVNHGKNRDGRRVLIEGRDKSLNDFYW